MRGEPIMHLLRVSDLNINHNVCTTTFESMLAGVPSIELQSSKSSELFGEEHLNLPQYVAKTVDQVDKAIVSEIINEKTKKNGFTKEYKEKIEIYIKKYAYKFDGQRCKAYANSIDQYIQKDINGINDITSFEKIRLLYYLTPPMVKQFIKKLKIIRLIRGENNLALIDKNKYHSIKIDKLGRYDNRIKPGDEEFWMKKFKDIN